MRNVTLGILAVMAGLGTTPGHAKGRIDSLSPIAATQTQTITITGGGFGTHAAYTGDSNFITFNDCFGSRKCATGWQAGYAPGGNSVGLVVQSWSDTQIVIGGFSGNYGPQYHLTDGDFAMFNVANPQTAKWVRRPCTTQVGTGLTQAC